MSKNRTNTLAKSVTAANEAVKKKSEVQLDLTATQSDELVYLPVAKIHPDPNQPRKIWEPEALKSLMASISETKGCKEPIKVRPHPEKIGEYMLIFGEGRWKAHKELKISNINAILTTAEFTEFDLRFEQMAENINRADMKLFDKAMGIKNLINASAESNDGKKLTFKAIGDKFGFTKTYTSRLMAILNTSETIQDLSKHDITQSLNVISYLGQLEKLIESDELTDTIEEYKKGNIGEKDLQKMITDVKKPSEDKKGDLESQIVYEAETTESEEVEKGIDSDTTENNESNFDVDENEIENKTESKPKIENSSNEPWEVDDFELDPTDNSFFIYIKSFEEPLLLTNEMYTKMTQAFESHNKK